MALDACVHCDCYETGKVRTPAPQPGLVYVDPETGEVALQWEEQGADQRSFDDWRASACEHGRWGELVSHRLGNIARISFLRAVFQSTPLNFPVLLSKVVYNGVHCGDTLGPADIERLACEMVAVHTLHRAEPSDEAVLRGFETQMTELIEAARKVRKPIVF
jgi:hypothetical protein